MTVKTDKKLWPLYILQVLKDHAEEGVECDEMGNRYLNQTQIVQFLESDYGIVTQRKAVAENLSRLYEISDVEPKFGFKLEYLSDERRASTKVPSKGLQTVKKGWRLPQKNDFDVSEIRMLVDEVISSTVIPPKQVRQLIERLRKLTPHKIVVPEIEREGLLPVINRGFFYNVELLNEAIQKRRLVRFVKGAFATDGKLHEEQYDGNIREYVVNPVQLLISKSHYYLLARFPHEEEIYKFRIELMTRVEILDEKADIEPRASKINVLRYRDRHSYMMSGEVMSIVLRVYKGSLHSLFDQFGPNVQFVGEKDDTVDVRLSSALYSVLFWALQYYRYVEVISPPGLREKLEVAGRVIVDMYAGKPGEVGFDARQTESNADYDQLSER